MSGTEVYMLPMITSGGSAMVKAEVWHEIHSWYRRKETKKAIARSLGLDVRTVRRILQQGEPQPYTRRKFGKNILTPWGEYIR